MHLFDVILDAGIISLLVTLLPPYTLMGDESLLLRLNPGPLVELADTFVYNQVSRVFFFDLYTKQINVTSLGSICSVFLTSL